MRRSASRVVAFGLVVALSGLLASEAAADGRKGKGRHGHHERGRPERVVVRVVEPAVQWSAGFSWGAEPACGCGGGYACAPGAEAYYHAGLGVLVDGVRFDLELGNAPPRGYGYLDPHRGVWIEDVRAYSTWCKRNDVRPMIHVVRFGDRCSRWRG